MDRSKSIERGDAQLDWENAWNLAQTTTHFAKNSFTENRGRIRSIFDFVTNQRGNQSIAPDSADKVLISMNEKAQNGQEKLIGKYGLKINFPS